MKVNTALVAALLFLVPIKESYALGMVSRACAVSAIPPALKGPALIFFGLLGMPTRLLDLPSRAISDQQRYWIHESLTTDYGSLRYYLFAENEVYQWWYVNGGGGTTSLYREFKYRSPWAAQSLPPEIVSDSRLAIFNFNRKVLYSVRAGAADIVTAHSTTSIPGRAPESMFFVMGKHYYYDPVTTAQTFLGTTTAADCNLGQWGFEDQ